MSSLHFPIILGSNESERVVIVHLICGRENYVEKRVVIANPADPATPLFKIPKKVKLIGNAGTTYKNIKFKKAKRDSSSEDRVLTATIKGTVIVPSDRNSSGGVTAFQHYYIDYDEFDDIVEFSCSIKTPRGEMAYRGKLHVVRPIEKVVKITADLGSDATQINYAIDNGAINSVPLIDEMIKAYRPTREYDRRPSDKDTDPVFIQQEKGSDDFYKTGNITYIDQGDISKKLADPDTFINFLTVSAAGKNANYSNSLWDIERQFDKKLVNIKMLYAELHAAGQDEVQNTVDFGYKGIGKIREQAQLLEVLKTVYRQMIEVSTTRLSDYKYFSVMLLVPNIYNQNNIDQLLYELNKLMNPDYSEENPEKVFDFRIISESDSAFIGLAQVGDADQPEDTLIEQFLIKEGIKEKKKKDVFLIIDSGKGTTDYSIILYESSGHGTANNSISSAKRGGIVGAGAAIDYVFARIFARQIFINKDDLGITIPTHCCDENKFIDRFMTMISSLQPTDQDKMMLIVEFMKVNFSGNSVLKLYTCFEDDANIIIQDLLDLDKDEKKIATDKMYDSAWNIIRKSSLNLSSFGTVNLEKNDTDQIESVCETIATSIIDNKIFKNGNTNLTRRIDYVIFTGRSFMFKQLKEAFVKRINKTGRRVIHPSNSDNILLSFFKRVIAWHKARQKEGWELAREPFLNLKIAILPELESKMKKISVLYNSHDLGVNCNSDLCCLDLIKGPNNEETMRLERFWEGFKGTGRDKGKTVFYIGYNERSFAPGSQDPVINHNEDNLVKMTLFPVQYVPIKLNIPKEVTDSSEKKVSGISEEVL